MLRYRYFFVARAWSIWLAGWAIRGAAPLVALAYIAGTLAGGGVATAGEMTTKLTAVPAAVHAGAKFRLKVHINVKAGFHIQSAHPLDQDFIPTKLTPEANSDCQFGPVQYPKAVLLPASTALTAAGKISVYLNDVSVWIPVRLKAGTPPGDLILKVDFHAQACNNQTCFMPVRKTLTVRVHVLPALGKGGTAPPGGTIGKQGGGLPQNPSAAILPATGAGASPPSGAVPQSGSAPRESIRQQLRIIQARPYHVPQEHPPLWELIVSALLGGLILNVMPCVLPVIPLKVLSMVQQAHGNRRRAVVHALAFSAGIISLFAGLAVAMGIYRFQTHHHLMYGMQYSHPEFLLVLGLVVMALALSMLGVWTIAAPRAVSNLEVPQGGLAGSFAMGLLATILATPCSAPYLGPLFAITLAEPTGVIVLFFMLIGVGMAVPYVILAAFPQWLNRVPRAGRWSELLKQALGLVMVGVAIYLLSSLPSQHALILALGLAVVLGAVLWVWGQAISYTMPTARIWTIRGAALVVGVALAAGIWLYNGGLVPRRHFASGRWQSFTLQRLDAGLRNHRPVVVDFTASWCINCHYVKHFVLDTAPVRNSFRKGDVLLLRADLTAEPPVEKALLYKLGWRSIPVLAVFSPAHPYAPKILHDLYSAGAVEAAVRQAGG